MPGARRLPRALVEKAREIADGRASPAQPRNAASVLLVRDRPAATEPSAEPAGEVELFWLHRQATMAFAASMAVFPGGSVEPSDFEPLPEQLWRGPSPAQWAARLGTEVELARALLSAAVRETFEECGVLFAGPGTIDAAELEQDRLALLAGARTFAELLIARDWPLRTDLLTPWACWVTPVFQPRRYRTWFFLATEPAEQRAGHVSSEAAVSGWGTPSAALVAEAAGEWSMMPPQYTTCVELHGVPDAATATALARQRELDPITPTARFQGDQAHLEIPEPLMALTDRVRAELGLL